MIAVRARVQLTIEMDVDRTFDDGCAMSHIYEEASGLAISQLSRGVWPKPGIIGEPKVTAVLATQG